MAGEPLVPAGGRFSGTLAFNGEARVDGHFEGRAFGRGELTLGPDASVSGEVDVDELRVAGELDGQVRARVRVRLEDGAQVRGNLEALRLEMDDGAVLDAECRTGSSPEEPGATG
jgi:cytoskeletal protein CcmA (bactofilin family)